MKYMVIRDSENSMFKAQGTQKDNEATNTQPSQFWRFLKALLRKGQFILWSISNSERTVYLNKGGMSPHLYFRKKTIFTLEAVLETEVTENTGGGEVGREKL